MHHTQATTSAPPLALPPGTMDAIRQAFRATEEGAQSVGQAVRAAIESLSRAMARANGARLPHTGQDPQALRAYRAWNRALDDAEATYEAALEQGRLAAREEFDVALLRLEAYVLPSREAALDLAVQQHRRQFMRAHTDAQVIRRIEAVRWGWADRLRSLPGYRRHLAEGTVMPEAV